VTEAGAHSGMSPEERANAWVIMLTFGVFVATGVAIEVLFTASGDVCDAFHESPNTPLGWSIVIGGAALIAAVGWRFRPRRWWAITVPAVAVHLMIYSWWVTPAGTC
jgi:hypothetical protein